MGRRYCLSAPANPLNEYNSLLVFKYSVTFFNSFSKTDSSIGWLTAPQSILSFENVSMTINLSFGERPVYLPVLAVMAPVEVKSPSPRSRMRSTNFGTDKLCSIRSCVNRCRRYDDSILVFILLPAFRIDFRE